MADGEAERHEAWRERRRRGSSRMIVKEEEEWKRVRVMGRKRMRIENSSSVLNSKQEMKAAEAGSRSHVWQKRYMEVV